MSTILKNLPIPKHDDIDFVGAEHVRLKADEIVVWVSLTTKKTAEWNHSTPIFPAILDTGHTHNFSIQDQHLRRWAGIQPETIGIQRRVRYVGRTLPLYAVQIWLHRNVPGKRVRLEGATPHLLDLSQEIAVFPTAQDNFPRLPLLGMRALLMNKLHLSVSGENRWANLRTPDWRTRLLNWLS